jgi:hypothetical protein
MIDFDSRNPERRPPSRDTPVCRVCDDAGLPRYGGNCYRHAVWASAQTLDHADPVGKQKAAR